jgi:hypothetical protein
MIAKFTLWSKDRIGGGESPGWKQFKNGFEVLSSYSQAMFLDDKD